MESHMTLLVTSIRADNKSDLDRAARVATNGGAEAIELRLDRYRGPIGRVVQLIAEHESTQWIVTNRSEREGGYSRHPPIERATLLATAAQQSHALIDFEFADFEAVPNVRPVLLDAAAPVADGELRLVLSSHDFDKRPADLAETVRRIHKAADGVIAKVAYRANDIGETFDAFDLMREHADKVIAIAMSEAGLWTRLLAKKLGAFASFCSLDDDTATAPGQLTLDQSHDRYRWRDISADTSVYGVLGRPVAHSMSPVLMNRWFAEAGIDAIYLPLLAPADEADFIRFLGECASRPWLDIGGFSVTLPHKSAAAKWAGDGADRLVTAVGAANTITYRDGTACAFNTDCYAAIDSMAAALSCARTDVEDLPVDVLGTGGVARALLAALAELGCNTTVFGRSKERTERLAKAFHAVPAGWNQREQRCGKVLINCTSVGMWPNVDESPIPASALTGCELVFDLVYNPLQTKLLADAGSAGIPTLNGLDMFLRQAAAQFELWTGTAPDIDIGRAIVTEHIQSQTLRGSTTQPPDTKRSIALIGLRGAGKTTVARLLADKLGGNHVDTDDMVVSAAGRTIADIFADGGEASFRQRGRPRSVSRQ